MEEHEEEDILRLASTSGVINKKQSKANLQKIKLLEKDKEREEKEARTLNFISKTKENKLNKLKDEEEINRLEKYNLTINGINAMECKIISPSLPQFFHFFMHTHQLNRILQ